MGSSTMVMGRHFLNYFGQSELESGLLASSVKINFWDEYIEPTPQQNMFLISPLGLVRVKVSQGGPHGTHIT